MKYIICSIVIMMAIGLLAGHASAGKDLVESISKDCSSEIARYCISVSPGRGRMLACLFAYSDKLTSICGFALMEALPQLDIMIADVSLAATECRDDLRAYCSKVRPGEGRLSGCLSSNKDKVSGRCREALKVGGFNEF